MRAIDGRGVVVTLKRPPARIVSLVPSATETLFALGAGDRVVGVTRFCVHPGEARALPKVGGTKDADPDRILALRPDLVVANAEENTRALFEALEGRCPLWVAFPRTVDAAIADLSALAYLVGADPRTARALEARVRTGREALHAATPGRRRVAWLIWNQPRMTIGDDTFLSAMLRECGCDNVFSDRPHRYPTVTDADLAAADPELVLLSSEPFPFADRHADALADATGLPRSRFRKADGELASWHGARMATAFETWAAWGGPFDPADR